MCSSHFIPCSIALRYRDETKNVRQNSIMHRKVKKLSLRSATSSAENVHPFWGLLIVLTKGAFSVAPTNLKDAACSHKCFSFSYSSNAWKREFICVRCSSYWHCVTYTAKSFPSWYAHIQCKIWHVAAGEEPEVLLIWSLNFESLYLL